jgi:hypothetical protein
MALHGALGNVVCWLRFVFIFLGFWKLWSMLVELGNHQSVVRSRPAARRRLHAALLLGALC